MAIPPNNGSSYDVAMASSLTMTQSQHVTSNAVTNMSSSLKVDHNAAEAAAAVAKTNGAAAAALAPANKSVAEGAYSHEV